MPNLSKKVNPCTIPNFFQDVRAALGVGPGGIAPTAVGVMIQYGKTKTSLKNQRKTLGGGHVCVFVIDGYGRLQAWDEVMDNSWQQTIVDSENDMEDMIATHLLRQSSINDVTVYVHPATNSQVDKVANRANILVGAGNLTYSHLPSIGKPVKHGDCVTRSSWVIGAFSWSPPFRGGLTPWGQSAIYEAYTSPLNLISRWVKIKYKGAKLPVMG